MIFVDDCGRIRVDNFVNVLNDSGEVVVSDSEKDFVNSVTVEVDVIESKVVESFGSIVVDSFTTLDVSGEVIVNVSEKVFVDIGVELVDDIETKVVELFDSIVVDDCFTTFDDSGEVIVNDSEKVFVDGSVAMLVDDTEIIVVESFGSIVVDESLTIFNDVVLGKFVDDSVDVGIILLADSEKTAGDDFDINVVVDSATVLVDIDEVVEDNF
ncbi:hypothetical protein Pmani_031606 [Petrolisthes manimaculis]|uniref:Uncharacterized protein n=1 Tax=Petrolisthes manimaculis TaxID=1843537 RepID=A0AAE1NTG0_9EUCA|nr:hypothetical protein Pmani_031606 [Petrolisthes manimaculis]